jgi:hypothetical protein
VARLVPPTGVSRLSHTSPELAVCLLKLQLHKTWFPAYVVLNTTTYVAVLATKRAKIELGGAEEEAVSFLSLQHLRFGTIPQNSCLCIMFRLSSEWGCWVKAIHGVVTDKFVSTFNSYRSIGNI